MAVWDVPGLMCKGFPTLGHPTWSQLQTRKLINVSLGVLAPQHRNVAESLTTTTGDEHLNLKVCKWQEKSYSQICRDYRLEPKSEANNAILQEDFGGPFLFDCFARNNTNS